MNLIEVKYGKRFFALKDEKFYAIKNIDLEVKAGEFLIIAGASGSGKSTLLNIIGCMDKLSEGELWIEGRNVNQLKSSDLDKIRNEKIGFIFQNFALLNNYSVYDNVGIPLLYRKISSSEKHKLIMKNLERLGIKDKAKVKPTELSGGQKQRVTIARCLCAEANIILADEPTGALDTENSINVMEILKELNREGKTIILITHNNELASYGDRIISLKDGCIVSEHIN